MDINFHFVTYISLVPKNIFNEERKWLHVGKTKKEIEKKGKENAMI